MARVCVDSGFLIGLYDERDQHHSQAVRQFDALFGEKSSRHLLVAPWPILYEYCGTKQAKNLIKKLRFGTYWNELERRGQLVRLDDLPYREQPLMEHMEISSRSLSLVDRVLRAMILDKKSLFDCFLTYNTGDFVDACQLRGIPLINEKCVPEAYGIG
jgi:predicted nucleic acid-binding protein